MSQKVFSDGQSVKNPLNEIFPQSRFHGKQWKVTHQKQEELRAEIVGLPSPLHLHFIKNVKKLAPSGASKDSRPSKAPFRLRPAPQPAIRLSAPITRVSVKHEQKWMQDTRGLIRTSSREIALV